MPITRRNLLRTGLGAAAAAGLADLAVAPSAAAASLNLSPAGYIMHAAPLQADAFLRLPPGSVRASGWIATQLDYQVNGLNGLYPQVSHFLDGAPCARVVRLLAPRTVEDLFRRREFAVERLEVLGGNVSGVPGAPCKEQV